MVDDDGARRSSEAEHSPLVTIGMPVFNEARFIESSLGALLAQDYPNFRVIVSDNASNDETADICERLSHGDARVSIDRLTENIGAAANFQRVLERADGDYFMWAGGHDLWSPNLLSAAVTALDSNSDAAIALATARWIDESGEPFGRHYGYTDTRGMHPIARLFTVFWGNMHPVLGLIRLRYLRDTPGFQALTGADLILLCQLALMGDFLHVPEALWSRREPRGEESHSDRMRRYTGFEYGLARTLLDRVFPLARLPVELVKVGLRAGQLSPIQRAAVLAGLLASFPVRYLAGRR